MSNSKYWEIRVPRGREGELERVPCGDLGIAGVLLHWDLKLSFFRFDGPRQEGEDHILFAITSDGNKRAKALKLGYKVLSREVRRKPGGIPPDLVQGLVRVALEGFGPWGPPLPGQSLFIGFDKPRFETEKELAEKLGVSPDTLTRWKREGAPGNRKAAFIKLFTPQAFLRANQPPLPETIKSKIKNAGKRLAQGTEVSEKISGSSDHET